MASELRKLAGDAEMSRDEIIAANPLEPFLRQRGYDLRQSGNNGIAMRRRRFCNLIRRTSRQKQPEKKRHFSAAAKTRPPHQPTGEIP
jgi:hypothetical protein